MKVSIIIPFKEYNSYVEESIKHCLQLDYKDFEIVLLPDNKLKQKFKKTRIIPTGPTKPSIKRNLGVTKAKGEIIAFLDSDAYPKKDWLKEAVNYFKNKEVGAIGGPNLVPHKDSILQKASDDILSSRIACGSLAGRYSLRPEKERSDLPSCNLLVRKSAFLKTKGYDPNLLTAEDIKLCEDIKSKGYKLVYTPKVIVYHHRRPLFSPHLKQMYIYGRDRATFSKQSGKLKLIYFLPSLWVIFLIITIILSFFNAQAYFIITSVLTLYLLIMLIESIHKAARRFYLVFPGIILTHLIYGIGFIYGFLYK